MKVGLSYSRCVKDIVDGRVELGEILVIVSRTDFDPHDDKQWEGIWLGYGGGSNNTVWQNPEWRGYTDEDEAIFREVSIDLWEMGKFFQPRRYGAHPRRLPYHWLEVGLQTEDIEQNPAVKQAWDHFQILAGLATKEKTPLDNNW